jgi:hypothetical protein
MSDFAVPTEAQADDWLIRRLADTTRSTWNSWFEKEAALVVLAAITPHARLAPPHYSKDYCRH